VPADGATEAMVKRVVHLGFEVRVELELPGGEPARAQLTRAQADELELMAGDLVYVRWDAAGYRVTQASGSSAS
jgi:sulfate transport system ATP-binding protein